MSKKKASKKSVASAATAENPHVLSYTAESGEAVNVTLPTLEHAKAHGEKLRNAGISFEYSGPGNLE